GRGGGGFVGGGSRGGSPGRSRAGRSRSRRPERCCRRLSRSPRPPPPEPPPATDPIMTPAKKLYIKTYGCQMNVYDSAGMRDVLPPLGYAPGESAREADRVILNPCHI